MAALLGIDLGTSNVVVAYMRGGQPVAKDWGLGDVLLPAFVKLAGDSVVVGKEARRAWMRGEPNCHRRFKLQIGSAQNTAPDSPAELMAHLARHLQTRVAHSPTNPDGVREITGAVITVPHSWNSEQRRATADAVARANLKVTRIVSEPIAAAAYYAFIAGLRERQTVLVCDMGGGTFDITLTVVEAGENIAVIERGTDTNRFAGTYADALIAARLLEPEADPRATADRLLHTADEPAVFRMLGEIEEVRLRLNKSYVEGGVGEELEEDLRYLPDGRRRTLTYAQMVESIQPVCDEAVQLIRATIKRVGGDPPTGIVLAGGMSKMAVVQEAIARAMGIDLKELRDLGAQADRAIAYGAVLIGEGRVKVREVLPLYIGIVSYSPETRRDEFFPLLPRDFTVPCEVRSQPFRTREPLTDTLELTIAMGAEPDIRTVQRVTKRYPLKQSLPAQAEFHFKLIIDENQLLTVQPFREGGDLTEPIKLSLAEPGV